MYATSVYVKLTYLRQSPAAVPVYCLGTSERAEPGRSPALAGETCYYTRMRKRRTGALRGSRKLLKMSSRIPETRSPFASNKHLPGVAWRRREDGTYVPGLPRAPGLHARYKLGDIDYSRRATSMGIELTARSYASDTGNAFSRGTSCPRSLSRALIYIDDPCVFSSRPALSCISPDRATDDHRAEADRRGVTFYRVSANSSWRAEGVSAAIKSRFVTSAVVTYKLQRSRGSPAAIVTYERCPPRRASYDCADVASCRGIVARPDSARPPVSKNVY